VRATTKDIETAQQKKITEKMANMIGSLSHPKAWRIARKTISTGRVTRNRVIMTIRGDGSFVLERDTSEIEACKEVERRETNIDPTLPGKPLITMASKGNPWYREANVSSTIPVALLMTIAPNSGVQPCHIRCLTTLLPRTIKAHKVAEHIRNNTMIRGHRVLTKLIKIEEIVPSKHNVTRSPRQDAIGGAMLSGSRP